MGFPAAATAGVSPVRSAMPARNSAVGVSNSRATTPRSVTPTWIGPHGAETIAYAVDTDGVYGSERPRGIQLSRSRRPSVMAVKWGVVVLADDPDRLIATILAYRNTDADHASTVEWKDNRVPGNRRGGAVRVDRALGSGHGRRGYA